MSKVSKLSDADKRNICEMYRSGVDTQVIADRYDIGKSYVKGIFYNHFNGYPVNTRSRMLSIGITREMIRETKSRVYPGMMVVCLDKKEECETVKKQRCRVIGTYPYVFAVRRPHGTECFTYVDLIRHYGVRMDAG